MPCGSIDRSIDSFIIPMAVVSLFYVVHHPTPPMRFGTPVPRLAQGRPLWVAPSPNTALEARSRVGSSTETASLGTRSVGVGEISDGNTRGSFW
jgi:hypothetical protein